MTRYDWYQTGDALYITILAISPSITKENIKIYYHEQKVCINLGEPANYTLDLDLYDTIIPDDCDITKFQSTSLEIRLRKHNVSNWPSLTKGTRYEFTRDDKWSKISNNIENDDKPKGEAALQQFFQSIYASASEDVKKAMNKSFQESGGTCLSTNWDQVKNEKVPIKPPEGVEPKNFK